MPMKPTSSGATAAPGPRTTACRKVEVLVGPDSSLAYRPILKVKGEQCDLGEYSTEK